MNTEDLKQEIEMVDRESCPTFLKEYGSLEAMESLKESLNEVKQDKGWVRANKGKVQRLEGWIGFIQYG